jgi:hypothetical protein
LRSRADYPDGRGNHLREPTSSAKCRADWRDRDRLRCLSRTAVPTDSEPGMIRAGAVRRTDRRGSASPLRAGGPCDAEDEQRVTADRRRKRASLMRAQVAATARPSLHRWPPARFHISAAATARCCYPRKAGRGDPHAAACCSMAWMKLLGHRNCYLPRWLDLLPRVGSEQDMTPPPGPPGAAGAGVPTTAEPRGLVGWRIRACQEVGGGC